MPRYADATMRRPQLGRRGIIDRHNLPLSPGDTAIGNPNEKKGGRAGKKMLTVEIQEGNQKTGPEDAYAKSRCEVYPDPKNRTFLRHAFTPGNSRIPDQGDKMSTMTGRNAPPEKETGRRQDSEGTSNWNSDRCGMLRECRFSGRESAG